MNYIIFLLLITRKRFVFSSIRFIWETLNTHTNIGSFPAVSHCSVKAFQVKLRKSHKMGMLLSFSRGICFKQNPLQTCPVLTEISKKVLLEPTVGSLAPAIVVVLTSRDSPLYGSNFLLEGFGIGITKETYCATSDFPGWGPNLLSPLLDSRLIEKRSGDWNYPSRKIIRGHNLHLLHEVSALG